MTESAEESVGIEEAMARLSLTRPEVYRRVVDKALEAVPAEGAPRFADSEVARYAQVLSGERETLAREVAQWASHFAQRLSPYGDVGLVEVVDAPVPEQVAELGRRIILDGILSGVRDLYLDPLHQGCRLLYGLPGKREEVARFVPILSEPLREWFKARVSLPAEGKVREGLGQQVCQDRSHQFRLTTISTLLGEHIHLQFYPLSDGGGVDALTYLPAQKKRLRDLLDGRPGLLLLAGPFGPVADEHRLALAHELCAAGRLVVSLEHRVQYHSELLVQLNCQEGEEGEPDALWRTALAMTPDALLVDEVRTPDDVHRLFEAVSSGIAVVGQVRAAGGLDGLRQLLSWEIDRQLLARDLLGLVEWTGLRRLCPHCRQRRDLAAHEAGETGVPQGSPVGVRQGCPVCGDGFAGRRAVYGLWPMDRNLDAWIRTPEAPETLLEDHLSGELSLRQVVRQAVLSEEVEWGEAAAILRGDSASNSEAGGTR